MHLRSGRHLGAHGILNFVSRVPTQSSGVMGTKTMLNIVGVIPSPQTSETEIEMGNVPLRVVTRAQAREAGREEESIRESPRHAKDTTIEKLEKK